MRNKTISVNFNLGWLGLLGVIFVLCKVFEYGPIAEWSWWLVLLPFYFGFAIILAVGFGALIVSGVVFAIAACMEAYDTRKRRIAREKDPRYQRFTNRK